MRLPLRRRRDHIDSKLERADRQSQRADEIAERINRLRDIGTVAVIRIEQGKLRGQRRNEQTGGG